MADEPDAITVLRPSALRVLSTNAWALPMIALAVMNVVIPPSNESKLGWKVMLVALVGMLLWTFAQALTTKVLLRPDSLTRDGPLVRRKHLLIAGAIGSRTQVQSGWAMRDAFVARDQDGTALLLADDLWRSSDLRRMARHCEFPGYYQMTWPELSRTVPGVVPWHLTHSKLAFAVFLTVCLLVASAAVLGVFDG